MRRLPARPLFAAACLLAWADHATAGEIYFATTTPHAVAHALVRDVPDATAQSGSTTNKFKALSGPGLLNGGSAVSPDTILSDSPTNYTEWTAGANAGQGFGPWAFQSVSTNAGFFIGSTGANTNMDVGSPKGFGLWASSGGSVSAQRTFATPMKAGDRFTVKFDNNWVVSDSQVGVQFRDNAGTVLLRFFFVGGQANYRISDATGERDALVPWTGSGLDLTLTVGAADTYVLDTGQGTASGSLAPGSRIARVEFFNNNAGPDTPYNLYIGGMSHIIAGAPIPVADTPTSSGGLRLVESAISPVAASAGGYGQIGAFASDALALAKLSLEGSGAAPARISGASEYRYGKGQNGGTNANWNIQFDGVPEKTPPIEPNFFASKIDEAVVSARAAIRANPSRVGQGGGYALLLQSAYENTVPRTYAGNEWRAQADKERLDPAFNATISNRITTLQRARDQYQAALAPFHALLNHPVESVYLWNATNLIGSAKPVWAAAGQTWTSLLFDAYANAVAQLAECQSDLVWLGYMAAYQVPGVGTFNPQPHVQAAAAAASEIDRLLLPFGALAGRAGLEPREEVSDARNASSRLKRLSVEFAEKCLSFDAGKSQETGNSYVRRSYGPYDVPFYSQDEIFGSSLTFNNLMMVAAGTSSVFTTAPGGLLAASKAQDATALASVTDAIDSDTKLGELRQGVDDTYVPQLRELCGQRLADPSDPFSNLVPDVMGFFLPPEARAPLAAGESYGAVYEQWNKIIQAETRLLSATRNLAAVGDEIEIVRNFGQQRLESFDRIYNIQLSTGDKIGALDYEAGEVRAEAIRAEAEARAKKEESGNWMKAAAKVAVAAAAIYVTGGAAAGLAGTYFGAMTTAGGGAALAAKEAADQAALYRQVGEIQAKSTLRLADIARQQTRLRALEGATITREGQSQEQTRIDEQIHKLMITVESRRLEILYAQQALDLTKVELSNMIGRVGYLLQEYRKANIRQANTTFNRPDVRLRRDYQIREADRKFRFAQEYCYLSSRAAEYRFLTTTAQSAVRTQTGNILRAQKATDLEKAAAELIKIRDQFVSSQSGRAPTRKVRLSLRNYVIQSNKLDGFMTLNGSWDGGTPPDAQFLHYADPATIQPTPMADLSDAQFASYLRDRLVGHPTLSKPGGGTLPRPYVDIEFRTGLEKDFGERSNPFYITGEYGHLIEAPNMPLVADDAAGIFLNIRNNRSSLVDTASVSVQLEQQGVSFVPYDRLPNSLTVINARAWNFPVVTASLPVIWNQDTMNTPNWKSLVTGSSQLNERSPVCDRWVLRISGSQFFWTQMLANIRDIELCMTVRGWTGQGLGTPPIP